MNCQDALRYVIEPGTPPEEVREHLSGCGECRARRAEARRVARLLLDLPTSSGSNVAERVMARIGYGNGRPTRDKILEQLEHVRVELDAIVSGVEADALARRPTPGEPSVGQIVSHLPSRETVLSFDAQRALASGDGTVTVGKMPGPAGSPRSEGVGHEHAINTIAAVSMEDLRRVRERTLRLVSGLAPKAPDPEATDLLREIYRHEADHSAQISDVVWRDSRRAQLSD